VVQPNDRYDIDRQTRKNTARYINHSCDPNCEIVITTRTIWIVAARDIRAGEELGYNYGYLPEAYATHPCTCGAQQCYGSVLARQYWDLLQQNPS
jgi:uncharacterized protein